MYTQKCKNSSSSYDLNFVPWICYILVKKSLLKIWNKGYKIQRHKAPHLVLLKGVKFSSEMTCIQILAPPVISCEISDKLTYSFEDSVLRTGRRRIRPWMGSSVGWNIVAIRQGWVFHLQSRHIQEATTKCINKRNNKLMFLSLSLFLSLKSINKRRGIIIVNGY